nr:MAG TPA: hypothetical protein [Caudoviricetes sp.]
MKLYEVLNLLGKRNSKVKITFNEDERYLSYTKVTIEGYVLNMGMKDLLPVFNKPVKRLVCHRGNYYEIFIDNSD